MRATESAVQLEVIVVCACLLGLIALALLYRQWRQERQIAQLRRSLQHEQEQRQHAEHALIDTRTQLCQELSGRERIKLDERQRIARDLHDDLGQQLLALTMEVCAIGAAHRTLKPALAQLDGHVGLAVRSLRCILKDLAPEVLECGLRAAFEDQLSQFSKLSGIDCALQAAPEAFSAATDERFQAALYRLLQESLSNIARHAQATAVQVALCRETCSLSMTVRDNGIGLPERVRNGAACLGTIRQRVLAAGGQLHIASAPGQGTALSMSFPLELIQPQPCNQAEMANE
jgi:signal transduction histidine kinase